VIKAANVEFVHRNMLLNAATQWDKGNTISIVGIGQDIKARWPQEREDSKLNLCRTSEFYAVKLEEEYDVRLLLPIENKLAGWLSNLDHNNCKEREEGGSIGEMRMGWQGDQEL
jgi:hypothetical protein